MLLLLFVVGITTWTPMKKIKLGGWQPATPELNATVEDWFDGSLQTRIAERFRLTFYTRTELALFYNQLRYTLFDDFNPFLAKDGRGRLYERDYQRSTFGEDYIGQEAVDSIATDVAVLRARLESRGQRLIVVLMPNKWRYFEHDWAEAPLPTETNYHTLKASLTTRGIRVMDVNDYFDTAVVDHPVYANNGSHWSLYGAAAFSQHLSNSLRSDSDMRSPRLAWELDSLDRHPHKADADLHRILNVLTDAEDTLLAYGRLKALDSHRVQTFWLGDSYFEVMEEVGIWEAFMAEGSTFCYYNKELRFGPEAPMVDASDTEVMRYMNEADLVVIGVNERALRIFGWGFLQRIKQWDEGA